MKISTQAGGRCGRILVSLWKTSNILMLMKKTLTLAIALAATLSLQAQNRSDLPDLSTIISSQPEGTLHKDVNHYFEGCYVYPSTRSATQPSAK